MPDNVYEIRFVGDAESITAAAEQAKAAVDGVGKAAAAQAGLGVKDLGGEVQKLHLGFRDTASAGRIFIYSLAQEMNPAVTAAIGRARMLSFALLNFRNILSPALIGTLAIAAGALQFYTNQSQRLTEVQIKANRAVREFDTGALTTGLRETNLEMEKLAATYEIRFEKFMGIGAIAGMAGGAIVGAKFGAAIGLPGGPAGALITGGIGAVAGIVGGAALFQGMNEQQKKEYLKIMEIYKAELAKLVPFEQSIAQAMRTSIESRYEMALALAEYGRRRMLGMPYEFIEKIPTAAGASTQRGIRAVSRAELSYVFGTAAQAGRPGLLEVELLKAQEAERISLEEQYQREKGKAAEAGDDAVLLLTEQFETKRTELATKHNQERIQLETQYGQKLLARAQELEERLGAIVKAELPLAAEEGSIALRKLFEPEATRELQNFTDGWKELTSQIALLGATADPAAQAFLRLYNAWRETLALRAAQREGFGPGGNLGVDLPMGVVGGGPFPWEPARDVEGRIASLRGEFIKLGQTWVEDVLEKTVNAERQAERDSLLLRIYKAPQEAALASAQAAAAMNVPGSGIQLAILRIRQQAGTFEENMAQMMEGIGSAMSRGLEDTFFSVVTGQFKGLVDVARQVGYAIVREMTRVTAQMATRGLFGEQGGTGGLFGSLLSMLRLVMGGGGGVPGAVPEILRGQHGGIFTKPTLTMIAEAGEAEAVIPLSKLGKQGGGGVTVINLSDRDQLAAIVAQEMGKGREVIVNDVVQGLRGNSALRRGVRRFT